MGVYVNYHGVSIFFSFAVIIILEKAYFAKNQTLTFKCSFSKFLISYLGETSLVCGK